MYIQITTRCNMHCAHCGMSCTAQGEDMSLQTFRQALEYSEDTVAIGGGEPTIHPLFWQFLGEAMACCEDVWLATNGKMTETALALAGLAKRGIIGCDLSQDDYHEPVDPRVVEAFTVDQKRAYNSTTCDQRGIRNVMGHEVKAGRCDFGEEGCICPDLFVKPDGQVYLCGCEDAPCIGSVLDGFNVPEDYSGECWKITECY